MTTSKERNQPAESFQEDYPTGWFALTRHRSVCQIVDALLDLPPHREFHHSELARIADVSRQSVHRHIEFLEESGILERVEATSPQRYRFDAEHPVSKSLITLDGALQDALEKGSEEL